MKISLCVSVVLLAMFLLGKRARGANFLDGPHYGPYVNPLRIVPPRSYPAVYPLYPGHIYRHQFSRYRYYTVDPYCYRGGGFYPDCYPYAYYGIY